MSKENSIMKALKKKALGFTADEVVEEYVSDAEGNLTLQKKKITTKYYPPDTAALSRAVELGEGLGTMSDEQLLAEKERLIKSLKENK